MTNNEKLSTLVTLKGSKHGLGPNPRFWTHFLPNSSRVQRIFKPKKCKKCNFSEKTKTFHEYAVGHF